MLPTGAIDVLVAGGGNAALCAAIVAREAGATVLVLECAPRDFRGGNSRHTRNLRYMHDGPDRILTGAYPEEEFWQDLSRVTKGKTNEPLARLAIRSSAGVGEWMTGHGVRLQPPLEGTLHLGRTNAFFLGGGKALVNAYYSAALERGIRVLYNAEVTNLQIRNGRFESGAARLDGHPATFRAQSLVVASAGFEANLEG